MADLKIVVVLPAYKSNDAIVGVLERMPAYVEKIIVVDDGCPNKTGELVRENVSDVRLTVMFNEVNLGVGGATIVGFQEALRSAADIVVKLDSDGQMNPEDIERLIEPLVQGKADYAKGNRFNSLDDLQAMPKNRILGNAALSIMSKLSTGYWSITDPTNGFLAITREALERIELAKLKTRWFFESDMLFRLSLIRAVVADVPLKAIYAGEKSNLKVRKVVFEFLHRHNVNFLKRILYLYYLREWSVASFELPASLILLVGGSSLGLTFWHQSSQLGQAATAGQVMLSVLPLILGVQLILSVLSFDVSNEPSRALYPVRRHFKS